VTFQCRHVQQMGMNVRHFFVESIVGDPVDDDLVAEGISGHFANEYKALIAGDARYMGVTLRIVEPTPFPTTFSTQGQGDGVNLPDILPGQVSGLITLRSETPGPAGRGRVYVPWPYKAADSATGDAPLSSYVALLNALALFFTAGTPIVINSSTYEMTNIVYRPAIGAVPSVQSPITKAFGRSLWATQRRRGGYGARNISAIPDV